MPDDLPFPNQTDEGRALIGDKLRPTVIKAVRRIDTRIGRIYEDDASYADVMDKHHGVLTDEAAAKVQPLHDERARFIRYLKATGGLPDGMTETY